MTFDEPKDTTKPASSPVYAFDASKIAFDAARSTPRPGRLFVFFRKRLSFVCIVIFDDDAHAQLAAGYFLTRFANDPHTLALGERIAQVSIVGRKLNIEFVALDSRHARAFERGHEKYLAPLFQRVLDAINFRLFCNHERVNLCRLIDGLNRGWLRYARGPLNFRSDIGLSQRP